MGMSMLIVLLFSFMGLVEPAPKAADDGRAIEKTEMVEEAKEAGDMDTEEYNEDE